VYICVYAYTCIHQNKIVPSRARVLPNFPTRVHTYIYIHIPISCIHIDIDVVTDVDIYIYIEIEIGLYIDVH